MTARGDLKRALNSGDTKTARVHLKQALSDELHTREELAEDVVAFADQRILMGDTPTADAALIGAVHESIPPHVLFNAIKAHARKKVASG